MTSLDKMEHRNHVLVKFNAQNIILQWPIDILVKGLLEIYFDDRNNSVGIKQIAEIDIGHFRITCTVLTTYAYRAS